MERVLRPNWLTPLVLLVCILGCVPSSFATTAIIPQDDDMIIGARVIVRGKILSIESNFDEQQGRIYTYIKLKVQEVLKGQITERKIVIKELGGHVGDRLSVVYGNPEFALGEHVLLYLDTWKDGSLRTYQMFLGKFSIVKDEKTGHEFAVRSVGDEHVAVLPTVSGQQSGAITDRMEISSYVAMIKNRLAATTKQSRRFEQTYYGGVPTLASPPGYSSDSKGGEIHPEFALLSPPARWFEPDAGQTVPYTLNPHASPDPNIPPLVVDPNDIAAAANSWSTVQGCGLHLSFAGNLDDCYTVNGSPGINVVSNNCDGRNSPSSGCSGILAWGGWSGGFYSPIVINGTTFQYRITQGFVSCNPWAACNFGDHCSVQFIVTHEMGHALGLGHSQYQQATMYAIAYQIARCAVIWTDDQDAIKFVYPGSGGGSGPLSITTTSLPNGTVGNAYSQSVIASGGAPPYTWSIVSGQGVLPTGMTLSSGGLISGTPSAAGTYNFTVRVTDSTSATAQRALSITVAPAGAAFDSVFISQTVPTTLSPGQQFTANVVWLNTGTQTWDGSTGLRLISQNPPNNVTWGGNTVLLTFFTVAPGEQLNVTFQATAPTTAGTYNFQWQVARDASNPFGQMSTNQVIQVGSGGGGGSNDAAFVSQNVLASMTVGQTSGASVTMRNSGTTTWTPGTYFLGSLNPAGNSIWGLSQVALPSSVAPGAQITFNFNVTAPSVAGTYNFQWGMLQSGVGSFGQPSTNVAVSVTSGGGGGGLNAQFISQNMPGTLNPGQSIVVTIQMKNNGTVAWSDTTNYKLGSQNPPNNTTWGLNRASASKWVPVGMTATFQFTITAPTTSGVYNFQWQMWNSSSGFFGDLTPNIAVQVGSGGGGTNGAAFVTQTVPSSMTAGQTALVSVTMRNTGTTTWAAPTYMLGSLNPQGNVTWGLSQAGLGGLTVTPGSDAQIYFTVSAPSTPGTYNFQWGMMQSGVGYFGSPSTNVVVTVTSGGGGGTNDGQFVTQNVPASIAPGQTANVSVTMMNSGTTTWAPADYSLVSQNPPGNSTWGLSQVSLASSVAPGSNVTFNFTITAPANPGTYNFQWQMNQSGVGYFGGATPNVAISVTSGSAPLTITTTSVPYGNLGVPYSAQIVVTGGTPAYTFSLSGSLPAGVTLNRNTGLISGTPTTTGTYNFTVTVRDQVGTTTSRSYKTFFR